MDRLRRVFKGKKNDSNQVLNKSTYSLVSCGDLTEDTLQSWMALPEEVKRDPSMEQIRKKLEEIGDVDGTPRNGIGYEQNLLLHKNSVQLLPKPDSEVIGDPQNGDEQESDIVNVQERDKSSDCTSHVKQMKDSRIKHAKYYTKMSILLGCWAFFTAVFLMYNEKEEIFKNSAVSSRKEKSYDIDGGEGDSIQVKLSGPFLSEHAERKIVSEKLHYNYSQLTVYFHSLGDNNTFEITEPWNLLLQENVDHNEGEPRTKVFHLKNSNSTHSLRIRTNATKIVAFAMSYTVDPLDVRIGVVYAVILLCGLYVLIIFEVINRTMAAITVSTCSLAALALVGERPSLPELVSWLDMETLLLLFSMMILVAIMAETGIFDYLAVFTFEVNFHPVTLEQVDERLTLLELVSWLDMETLLLLFSLMILVAIMTETGIFDYPTSFPYEVTKGRLWPLIYLLCIITAVLSTFLDNVTTVLLMSPVTIRLCEVMDLDPVPILMFMAIYSNVGGTATPVGDPPNVIVASNKAVIQAGINFTNFTLHMALGVLFVCAQTSLQIRLMFRDTNKLRQRVARDIQDVRHQISIWRRAVDSLPHLSKGVALVRERLERKISKLNQQLEKMLRDSSKRACPKETFKSTLEELKNKYKIRDKALLVKSSVAIAFVVTIFFMHSIPELNRVSLGMTALLGAILLLTLADREDLEPILHRVEWSTLLFFAALFVLMEALSKLGLILYIGTLMEQLILTVDESARLAVALTLILWVGGTISAFVDNIPFTTMMVRVVVSIGTNPNLNLPMAPLVWALLFGACLGGNGTLIGASANVVCAGVAEQHGYKFTFPHFFRVGFPIMIGHLAVSSVYLLICHCVFEWH